MPTAPTETKDLLFSKATIAALMVFVLGLLLLVIPSLLGYSGNWVSVPKQIASVLIPSGLIATIYEFLLRRTFLKEMQEQLEKALRAAFGSFEGLNAAGVMGIHPTLSNDFIADNFANASESIRILQTWMGNYTLIQDSLEKAAKAGRTIEILLTHPRSAQSAARSSDLGWTKEDDVSPKIEGDIKQLNHLCMAQNLSNIKLHLYTATPVMTLYWYDDTCYLGLFWRKRPAIRNPQVEIRMKNSYFGDQIRAHFVDLWNNSKTIDLTVPVDVEAL
ncbi:MAG: hypothetical protein QOH41_2445 [Blastocatellia bacterium]|jgi:hypothetical protein|nr:hypothetical protein [Blastocatellia bacterium]